LPQLIRAAEGDDSERFFFRQSNHEQIRLPPRAIRLCLSARRA
jgi:hypothetical protein